MILLIRQCCSRQLIGLTGIRALDGSVAFERQIQPFAVFAHPADLPGRNAGHQCIGFDIAVDNCPGSYKSELANGYPQPMVQLAPRVAPLFTLVTRYSSLRVTDERGLYTLVKTMLGPQKTSSSRCTAS